MKDSTALKRKMGRMITKNLIILLVVAVLAVFAIWAWFTSNRTVTANGMSVKAKVEGIEVSWTGEEGTYYKDLTAMDIDDVVEKQTGLAKEIDADLCSLKLITGNGTDFFEPLLNRRTGEPLMNDDDTWQGSVIDTTDANKTRGRFIDIPLYFRSTDAKDIYLTGASRVTPKSTTDRMSDFGAFSKDYICAASRFAFFYDNVCQMIWAPNSDYELEESETGYVKYTSTDTYTETITTSADPDIPDEMLMNSNGQTYYFWSPSNYSSDQKSSSGNFVQHQMTFQAYSGTKGLYIFDYTITASMRSNDPTYPFVINTNSTTLKKSDVTQYIDTDSSKITQYNNSGGIQHISFNGSGFNVTFGTEGSQSCPSYWLDTTFDSSNELHIIFGYNPTRKQVIILGYHDERGNSQSITGSSTTTTTVEYPYYRVLNNNTSLAIINADSAQALSTDANINNEKAVGFKADGSVLPSSISSKETFFSQQESYDADNPQNTTYKFKIRSGSYLKIVDNDISFTTRANATEFYLKYSADFSAPLLQTPDGDCLVHTGSGFALVSYASATETNFATIYLGSSYEFITNSTSTESYGYYKSGDAYTGSDVTRGFTRELGPSVASADPPLFTSKSTDTATTIVGKKNATTYQKVGSLIKALETDQYATGVITIRIWVEGTDREAKTPLADGRFEALLNFTSILPTS